jgi:hypothetical protein
MSFLKKRLSKLKPHFGESNTNSSTESVPGKDGAADSSTDASGILNAAEMNGAQTPERSDSRRQSRERRSMDKERAKEQHKKRQSLARIEDEKFLKEGPETLTKLYRPYSMIQSKHWRHEQRALFKDINWAGK